MNALETISSLAVPLMFFGIIIFALWRNVPIFSTFTEGAKSGIETTLQIIPPLVGLMTAISVFRASGALDFVVKALDPVTSLLKIPGDIMPLALLRPVSGSASLAIINDIYTHFGPDSLVGRMASVMMGSTETTFYTVAVYFAAAGIKRTRHTFPSALTADLVGILTSVWLCYLFFGL